MKYFSVIPLVDGDSIQVVNRIANKEMVVCLDARDVHMTLNETRQLINTLETALKEFET